MRCDVRTHDFRGEYVAMIARLVDDLHALGQVQGVMVENGGSGGSKMFETLDLIAIWVALPTHTCMIYVSSINNRFNHLTITKRIYVNVTILLKKRFQLLRCYPKILAFRGAVRVE